MARSKLEREIGNAVVKSVLKMGKRNLNRRARKGGGFSFLLVVLLILGFYALHNEGDVDESSQDFGQDSAAVVEKFEENASGESRSSRYEVPREERVTIERCVDGDTLVVRYESNGQKVRERVRLIGVNTPETVKPNSPVEPFGPEASAYTKRRVEDAGGVATLVSDGSAYDKYNRRLAFVYLGNETISLNEDLACQGLAKVELQYSYSREMKDRLQSCANLAKRERLGIYGGN